MVLNTLNRKQKEAVHHVDGPCFVMSGPGSGKTRVLTERYLYFLNELNIPPEEIAIMTFTRKAAGENRRRLVDELPPEMADRINVSNLHREALSIATTAKKINDQPIPEVIGAVEGFEYLREAMAETGFDPKVYSPIKFWEMISYWKTSEREMANLDPTTINLIHTYQRILAAEKKWDIADLIINAIDALNNNPVVLKAINLRYLMVDEWQDTSMIEYLFIKKLLNGSENLLVVGAPAQSIYQWRGADFDELNMRFIEDFTHAKIIHLNECYRYGEQIAQAAASVVPTSPEVWMITNQPSSKVVIMDNINDLVEADRIAKEIKSLNEKHLLEFSNIAILFRTWRQASQIEKALIEHKLPYLLFGDNIPHFEKREIRKMLAYLRVIHALHRGYAEENLNGSIDLIINSPPRGIGPASVRTIRGDKAEIGWMEFLGGMINKNLRKSVREKMQELFDCLNKLAKKADVLTPEEMIKAVIRETDWERKISEELDGKKVLRTLYSLAQDSLRFNSLPDFILWAEKKMRSDINGHGITLSTIHASKGLEWDVVFVAGMNEKIIPHVMALEISDDPAEERNLAHVAFSRAKRLLALSWFRERSNKSDRINLQKPSRYLSMIPDEVISDFVDGCTGEGVLQERPAEELISEMEEYASYFG